MLNQTANLIQASVLNLNIKWRFIKMPKHGTRGTHGTLNVNFSSEEGCLPIIIIKISKLKHIRPANHEDPGNPYQGRSSKSSAFNTSDKMAKIKQKLKIE